MNLALPAKHAHAVVHAGLHALGRPVGCEGGELDAAFDVEHELVGILGVLLEVFVEEGQGVVVGRPVKLAAVKVVTAGGEGGFDGGEGLVVREGIGTPGEAWVI